VNDLADLTDKGKLERVVKAIRFFARLFKEYEPEQGQPMAIVALPKATKNDNCLIVLKFKNGHNGNTHNS
jgi:hypothetical protein